MYNSTFPFIRQHGLAFVTTQSNDDIFPMRFQQTDHERAKDGKQYQVILPKVISKSTFKS